MSDMFVTIWDFYAQMLQLFRGISFGTTSVVAIGVVTCILSAFKIVKGFGEWQDADGSAAKGLIKFARTGGYIWAITFCAGISPLFFVYMQAATAANLDGLGPSIATNGGALIDASTDALKVVYSSHGQIEAELAESDPMMFDGLQNPEDTLAAANMTQSNLAKLKTRVTAMNASLLKQANSLLASKNPAVRQKGQKLKDRIAQSVSKIDAAIAKATTSTNIAQGMVAQKKSDDAWMEKLKADGFIGAAIHAIISGVTYVGDFFLVFKRIAAGTYAMIPLILPILAILLGAWKQLQGVVAMMAFLVAYMAITTITCKLLIAIGPISIALLLTDNWRKYADSAISVSLQALFGSICLGAIIKIMGPLIASFGALVSTSGIAIYLSAISAPTLGEKFVESAIAAGTVLLVGFGWDSFAKIVEKAPAAGSSVITGHMAH